MSKSIDSNRLFAALLIVPKFHELQMIASKIQLEYGHQLKLFISQSRDDALFLLENLYFDGIIASDAIPNSEGINLLRNIRGLRKYKTAPLITISADPSEKWQVHLQNAVKNIAHFKTTSFDEQWDWRPLLEGISHLIDVGHERNIQLTFAQKRQDDLTLNSRDFILARPLLGGKKTEILYRDDQTGEHKQYELLSCTFEEAHTVLKKSPHALKMGRSITLNPNMVENIDYVLGSLNMRHLKEKIPIPDANKPEIYQLFKGWS